MRFRLQFTLAIVALLVAGYLLLSRQSGAEVTATIQILSSLRQLVLTSATDSLGASTTVGLLDEHLAALRDGIGQASAYDPLRAAYRQALQDQRIEAIELERVLALLPTPPR